MFAWGAHIICRVGQRSRRSRWKGLRVSVVALGQQWRVLPHLLDKEFIQHESILRLAPHLRVDIAADATADNSTDAFANTLADGPAHLFADALGNIFADSSPTSSPPFPPFSNIFAHDFSDSHSDEFPDVFAAAFANRRSHERIDRDTNVMHRSNLQRCRRSTYHRP